jgi:hypothetical protein
MDPNFRVDLDTLSGLLESCKIRFDEKALNEFVALEGALRVEVSELMGSMGQRDSDGRLSIDLHAVPNLKARMLVRSIFACLEGIVFGMKQLAAAVNGADGPLSAEERIVCKELAWGLTGRGLAKSVAMHLPAEPNVKFAFAVTAKAFRVSFKLDTSSQGWQCFVRSRSLRNRLTHPKRASDLEISNVELREAIEAFDWFNLQLGVITGTVNSNLQKATEYLGAMLELIQQRSNMAADTGSGITKGDASD